jgi:Spy/CpxP family protein refolding chaperone
MTRIGVLLLMILFAWGITAQQRPQPSADVPAAPSAPAPPAAAPGQPDVFGVTPRVPGTPPQPQAQQPQPATPVAPGAKPIPAVPSTPSAPAIPSVPPMDPLGDVMFPPDLILGHSREIMLTAEQKSFMRGEIQKTTNRFNELQWALHDSMEDLHQVLEASSVNDQQALALLDKVLDIEREIKRLHFGMGIRLKNKLTPDQQAKLQSIRMGRPWAVGPKPIDNP